ncbi:hypothetical protein FGO68_gene17326 [Halteria grandinella]|uniref:Uncharacterized protein n=1 Tax=Halteria grandinella TaxID=5974 RepID=A0A8J8NI95_HALGN|nr:hypothetical protein FGO68_gene17326 [Halteria grandinella]
MSTQAFQILKIDRQIQKEGLHRDLITNITSLSEDSAKDLKCSLVFREDISSDIYIYLEEVQVLKNFDFWPHEAQDIEKPASVAKTYEFIWRLPLDASNTTSYGTWVKNYESRAEGSAKQFIHHSIQYPFHFRYQPASDIQNITKVPYPGPPQAYLDCASTPLESYSISASQGKALANLINERNQPSTVYGMIPNGIKGQLEEIQFFTFGSTIIGFFILAYTIVQKSNEKVKLD